MVRANFFLKYLIGNTDPNGHHIIKNRLKMKFTRIIHGHKVRFTLADCVIVAEYSQEERAFLPFYYVKGFNNRIEANDFFISLKNRGTDISYTLNREFETVNHDDSPSAY